MIDPLLRAKLTAIRKLAKELHTLYSYKRTIAHNEEWYDKDYKQSVYKRIAQIEEALEPLKSLRL